MGWRIAQWLGQPSHSQRDWRSPGRYGCDEFAGIGFDEVADMAGVDHVAYYVCQIEELNTIEEAFASEHGKQQRIQNLRL